MTRHRLRGAGDHGEIADTEFAACILGAGAQRQNDLEACRVREQATKIGEANDTILIRQRGAGSAHGIEMDHTDVAHVKWARPRCAPNAELRGRANATNV